MKYAWIAIALAVGYVVGNLLWLWRTRTQPPPPPPPGGWRRNYDREEPEADRPARPEGRDRD